MEVLQGQTRKVNDIQELLQEALHVRHFEEEKELYAEAVLEQEHER